MFISSIQSAILLFYIHLANTEKSCPGDCVSTRSCSDVLAMFRNSRISETFVIKSINENTCKVSPQVTGTYVCCSYFKKLNSRFIGTTDKDAAPTFITSTSASTTTTTTTTEPTTTLLPENPNKNLLPEISINRNSGAEKTMSYTSAVCNDCVLYSDCPEAKELALYSKNDKTAQLFKKASCGIDMTSGVQTPKVCCSKFLTEEDKRIKNHPNLKLLPEECGFIEGNRIVGGTQAGLYEFPWMALISYRTRYGLEFQCGGSIINKRYVLTAAHCVKNRQIAFVRVGEYDIRYKTDCRNNICEKHIQNITVEAENIHPEYQGLPMVINDVALLRLAEDIDFNYKNVDAICLPTTPRLRSRSLGNERATVAGWGITENNSVSPVLLKVTIPILSAENCSALYNRYSKPGEEDVTEKQICAGMENKNSCNGDSGGPLMFEEKYNNIFRYIQYGVVSFGPQKCSSDNPAVYTDLRKYMEWIVNTIKP